MAKVRNSYIRSPDSNVFESYSVLDLVSSCDESPPDHGFNEFDFGNLICKNESGGRNFFSDAVWPSLDHDLASLTQSNQSNVNNSSESVSLSSLAQTHFLSNHTTNKKVPNEINNSVNSLADYFKAASTEQGLAGDSSENNNSDKQQLSLADLYFAANDEDEITTIPEVDLNICIKPEITSKSQKQITEDLNGIIHSSQQKAELCDVVDLLSAQTIKNDVFSSDLKRCVTEKETKCSLTKNFYPSSQIHQLNVKSSLFAKALSCKQKTNNLLCQKVARIERDLTRKNIQSFSHKIGSSYTLVEPETNTVTSLDQTIFIPKNFIRTYGTEKISK